MRCLSRITAALIMAFGTFALAEDAKPTTKTLTDSEFVKKAASGGMFEVESSKIALKSATDPELKKFAETMIKDHTKANMELKSIAAKCEIDVPSDMLPPQQKALDKVMAAKGDNFDKVYTETQLKGHEETIALFEEAAKSLKDPALKMFAEKTLPTLKSHLEMIQKQK